VGAGLTSELITASATVVLVLVTGLYVYLTHRLVSSQQEELDLASMPLLACRLTNEESGAVLHVENAGENVVLDIDVVVCLLSPRTARDPLRVSRRTQFPWVPARGTPPEPVGLAPVSFESATVLLQFSDVRGHHYAQVQFYAVDEHGHVETTFCPSVGERRDGPIHIGDLSDPDIPDVAVAGFRLHDLAHQLRAAAREGRSEVPNT
jgi:hypothetical protein